MKTAETTSSLRVVEDILDLIGNTPLLHLKKLTPPDSADVYAKLEAFQPGFSVKDRAALGMVLRAERDGKLKPGDTIVEATAGNTGVGLALVGVQRGYKVVFYVPEKFSQEKVQLMEAFGAKVIRTPNELGMTGAIDPARKFAKDTPNVWFAAQFENPGNPEYHYETTGREICEAMQGRVDGIAIGAGTGGTFTGVAKYLKEHCGNVHCALVESQGSIYGGGKAADHQVEGIGASFIPAVCDMTVVDEVITVSDREAFAMVRELAVKEGVLGGSSSGAAVVGALRVAKKLGAGKRVVTIIPDSAERYLSKDVFNFKE